MLEIVLDRFSHVSHGRVVGTTEHFARVSSRIEPAYLFNLRERAEFHRFREKKIVRLPPPRRNFVSLFHS